MHGANNYPWRTKMKSNYDIDLNDHTTDQEYLRVLAEWLPVLLDKHQPSLVFFQVFGSVPSSDELYVWWEVQVSLDDSVLALNDCVLQAGVDALEEDTLGRLAMTRSVSVRSKQATVTSVWFSSS